MLVQAECAFAEALVPFVSRARQALPPLGLLSEASADLERPLLKVLSFACAPTLLAAFARVRDARYPLPQLRPATSELYDAFVVDLLEGGWARVFAEWRGLEPLVLRTVDQWLAATAELSRRLDDDAELLRARFAVEGTVTAVETPLSDRHHDGRSVACLHFGNGVRVIYKPRSLQLEAAWSTLMTALPLQPYAPLVLDRGDYGWMEHVAALRLPNDVEAREYYRRVGVLLCAAFFFEATDLHVDNLVAHGAHPVLVDLEGLLAARGNDLFPGNPDPALAAGNARLWRSVLRSRMLPRWRGNGEAAYDLSALGTLDEQTIPERIRGWRDIATDRMDTTWVHAQARPSHNVPRGSAGTAAAPESFEEDIVAGFELAWEAMRTALGPALRECRGAVSRFLLRPTLFYYKVLEAMVVPECLRETDGPARLLARVAASTERHPSLQPLAVTERDALARLDVPWIGVPVEGLAFDGTAAPVFREPAVARAAAATEDLDFQVQLIRLSLSARRGVLGWSRTRVVRALLRHAVEAEGHATWIGLRRLEGTGKCDVGPLDATERLRLARLLARVDDDEAIALARRAARRALGAAASRLPPRALVKACRPLSLERIRRDVLGFFVEMATQGDIAHAHVAGLDVYLASTPAAAREVMVRRADVFSKGHGVGVRPAETGTQTHVAWLHQLGQVLRRWDPPPVDAPRHLSNPLNVTVAMRELSLDVIGQAMFGDTFAELRGAAGRYADRVVRFAPAPLGGLEPPMAAPPDFLEAERDFTRRMEMLEPGEDTLFHRLRGMHNERGERIETAYALEVARVLLLGGFDTVATLLTWTIVLLAQHPQPPEVDDMWILSEVLRLYPPAWCLSRRARVDVSLQGHDVKAGSLMIVSLWQLQRDARSFPDPDRFDPLRWAPGNTSHVREAYAPFGFGPRRCIGETFGWTHASRILRQLRARWRFVLRDARPIHPTVMLVLRPPEDLTVDLVEIS